MNLDPRGRVPGAPLDRPMRVIFLCTSLENNILLIFVTTRRKNKPFSLWPLWEDVESNYDAVQMT